MTKLINKLAVWFQRVLSLMGNPVTREIKNYRKTVTVKLVSILSFIGVNTGLETCLIWMEWCVFRAVLHVGSVVLWTIKCPTQWCAMPCGVIAQFEQNGTINTNTKEIKILELFILHKTKQCKKNVGILPLLL